LTPEGDAAIDGDAVEYEDQALAVRSGCMKKRVLACGQIRLDHSPSEAPHIETYATPNPLDDESFRAEALRIGKAAADSVRESISIDWPRRSTKPDAKGRVEHPLFGGLSAEWFCLHCDHRSTGAEMAANMWHCPECNATPIDMHSSPWWKEPFPEPKD
jgi:hypothetical protein